MEPSFEERVFAQERVRVPLAESLQGLVLQPAFVAAVAELAASVAVAASWLSRFGVSSSISICFDIC